jgi:hypothetical protein
MKGNFIMFTVEKIKGCELLDVNFNEILEDKNSYICTFMCGDIKYSLKNNDILRWLDKDLSIKKELKSIGDIDKECPEGILLNDKLMMVVHKKFPHNSPSYENIQRCFIDLNNILMNQESDSEVFVDGIVKNEKTIYLSLSDCKKDKLNIDNVLKKMKKSFKYYNYTVKIYE